MKSDKTDPDINYIIQMSLIGDKNYQEILLNKLKPLIYKNVNKYIDLNPSLKEDFIQEGYALILESLKTYDTTRNVHFLYYVKTKLNYYYKNYFKNEYKKHTYYLSQNQADSYSLFDLDNVIEKEKNKLLLESIKKLNKDQQKILYLYYYEKHSLKEISNILNKPYRTVIGKKKAAIEKLKKLLSEWRWDYGGYNYNDWKLWIPHCGNRISFSSHRIPTFPIEWFNSRAVISDKEY